MAKNRNTALRRRLGGVVVGASVLVSGLAFSGAASLEPLAAFAADTTCTPGIATLSAKKVEKGKEFTALVCGFKEGEQVRGEYRKAPQVVSNEAMLAPIEGLPEEPLGYSRDVVTVGADGRATVTFVIAEPGTYSLTVATLEGESASKAQVEITDQPPVTTSPAEPSDPTPSPTRETTTEPTAEPTATPSPTEEPTAKPSSEPSSEPSNEPSSEPSSDPTPEPTPKPTETPEPSPTPEPTPSPSGEPSDAPEPSPTVSPTKEPDPSERPTTAPSEPAAPSPTQSPSPLPGTGPSPTTEPSENPQKNETTRAPNTDDEHGDVSTEAGGSYFVRPKAARMSRIPARVGHGRSADFGAVGSDYSKLANDGGVARPGPTPGASPSPPEDEPTEGSTQLITDPSRQPLGLSVAWLIGGVIAGLGLAATGAIVLMRRGSDR